MLLSWLATCFRDYLIKTRISGSICHSPYVKESNHEVMSRCQLSPCSWVSAEQQIYGVFIGSVSKPSSGINYSVRAVCRARQNNFHSSTVSMRLMKETISLEWNTKLSFVLSILEKIEQFFSPLPYISAFSNKLRLDFHFCQEVNILRHKSPTVLGKHQKPLWMMNKRKLQKPSWKLAFLKGTVSFISSLASSLPLKRGTLLGWNIVETEKKIILSNVLSKHTSNTGKIIIGFSALPETVAWIKKTPEDPAPQRLWSSVRQWCLSESRSLYVSFKINVKSIRSREKKSHKTLTSLSVWGGNSRILKLMK